MRCRSSSEGRDPKAGRACSASVGLKCVEARALSSFFFGRNAANCKTSVRHRFFNFFWFLTVARQKLLYQTFVTVQITIMKRITLLIVGIFLINNCASKMYKTDIGEVSEETKDEGYRVVMRLNEGVSYPVEYDYEKPGDARTSYTKRKFFTEVGPSEYDFALLRLLIGLSVPVAYKFVAAQPQGMRYPAYYLQLSDDALKNPREISIAYLAKPVVKTVFKTDMPISLIAMDKKQSKHPQLLRGVYNAVAWKSPGRLIDQFNTLDGFTGYYIRYQEPKTADEQVAYLLMEGLDKYIFVRVNSAQQNKDLNMIVGVPGTIMKSLDKQINLYINAAKSIRSPCESKIGNKAQEECFAAEAVETQKRRFAFEQSQKANSTNDRPHNNSPTPREKTENEKWRSCHASGQSGCGYR